MEKTIRTKGYNKCLDLYDKYDIYDPLIGTNNCEEEEILKWEYNEKEKTFTSEGKCLSSLKELQQTEVWAGNLSDGNKVVLLLNRATFETVVEIKWSELGLNVTKAYLRDLWEQKYLGGFNNSYKGILASHESQLLKVYENDPEKKTDENNNDNSDENNDDNNDLILGLTIGVLILLLAFIFFIIIFMKYKQQKEENKAPDIDTEYLNSNLVRETKNLVNA